MTPRRLGWLLALALALVLAVPGSSWSASTKCSANDIPCRTAANRTAQHAGDAAAPDAPGRPLHADQGISIPGVVLLVLAGVGTTWLLGARVRRRMIGI